MKTGALELRLRSLTMRIGTKYPLFAFLLYGCKRVIVDGDHPVKTAGASTAGGGTLYFNVGFCGKLTDSELSWVMCHESLHIALLSEARRKGRDQKLWNIAHDYVINGWIDAIKGTDTMLQFPKGGCLNRSLDALSGEEVYVQLLSDAGKEKPRLVGLGPDFGGDLLPDMGEEEQLEALQVTMQHRLQTAVQAQKQKGTIPASLEKTVSELAQSTIAWKDWLMLWLGDKGRGSTATYTRPSRRDHRDGLIHPGYKRGTHADVCVFFDTSGSMDGTEGTVVGEFQQLLEETGMAIRYVCCDCAVHAQASASLNDTVELIGGGGSDFQPAFEELTREQFDGVVIALTDGYISVPPEQPAHLKGVIWGLVKGGTPPVGWGIPLDLHSGVVRE